MNHYERLKVTPDAPPEVIRAAYRALAAKLHPDRNGGKGGPTEQSHEQMVALNNSYLVLMDPVAREGYDAELLAASRTLRAASTRPSELDEAAPDTEPQTRVDLDWPTGLAPATGPWYKSKHLVGAIALSMTLVMGALSWWAWHESQRLQFEQGAPDGRQAAAPVRPIPGIPGLPPGQRTSKAPAPAGVPELATLPGFADLPPEVRAQIEAAAANRPGPTNRSQAAGGAGMAGTAGAPEKLATLSNDELLAQLPELLNEPVTSASAAAAATAGTPRRPPAPAAAATPVRVPAPPLPVVAAAPVAPAPAVAVAQAAPRAQPHPLDGKRLDGMRLDLQLRMLPAGRLRGQTAASAQR